LSLFTFSLAFLLDGLAPNALAEPVPAGDSPPIAAVSGAKLPIRVAILIYPGVELMDFAGPAEVFIVAAEGKAYQVHTVAEKAGPLQTMGGITIRPDFTLADSPAPDVLIVPGGNMGNVTPEGREWIKKTAGKTQITMSVCMGALLLAQTGLLDGIEATTHHWGIANLKKAAPNCTVLASRRFVDSGKIITTAGVTAGIDGALHIVERQLGQAAAKWTAAEWMEHPATHNKSP
jgi:transcriptional regulator GlxA family with amidase domain